MAKKSNAHNVLLSQRISFGQALYTRGGLLRELQSQGYTAQFIDFLEHYLMGILQE